MLGRLMKNLQQKLEEIIMDNLFESFIEMVVKRVSKDFNLGLNCRFKSGKVADIEMQFHLDDKKILSKSTGFL